MGACNMSLFCIPKCGLYSVTGLTLLFEFIEFVEIQINASTGVWRSIAKKPFCKGLGPKL